MATHGATMKILCVTYCYPPLQYPATMCNVKVVAGLVAHGVEVEVVTINPDTFYFPGGKAVDPSMMSILPAGVKNHQIRSWESNPFVVRLRENRFAHRLLYKLFDPRKREWTFPALRYLKKMDLSRFDAILTCSQPHCNHLIGMELKKLTGKPWIAYFSDPWTDNVYASFPTPMLFNYNLQLETEVMNMADRIFFTSPEIRELVMGKFPENLKQKCGILTHSFVPEWYRGGEPQSTRQDNRIVILQTGHFYGPRSPLPLFRALEELNRTDILQDKLHFIFYGGMKEEDKRFLNDKGLSGIVTLVGTVPYLESLAEMGRADYLLLIDAPLADSKESVFLPSKLVDYLGSGKPIIGITPEAGASARVLRETGNLVCDIDDNATIVDMLKSLAQGQMTFTPDLKAMNSYNLNTVTSIMKDALQGVLKQ